MNKISILMYHQVGEFARPAAHRSTYCHIRRFKAQMAYLRLLGYRVISLPEAVAAISGEIPLQGHSVVLTFDDGYQNFYDYAFPVLRRHGFPATVFLVSDLLGQPSRWLGADGREAPPLMDTATLRKIRPHGITLGAHTLTHPRLSRIDRGQMRREVFESKEKLAAMLGEEIEYFCYPAGDFDAEVVATVRQAGYRAALSCIRASAVAGDDLMLLPRKAISYGDSLAGFFWKLHMKNRRKPITDTCAVEKT